MTTFRKQHLKNVLCNLTYMNFHLLALPLLSGWGLAQVRAEHLDLFPDSVVKGPAVNRCIRPSEKTF